MSTIDIKQQSEAEINQRILWSQHYKSKMGDSCYVTSHKLKYSLFNIQRVSSFLKIIFEF